MAEPLPPSPSSPDVPPEESRVSESPAARRARGSVSERARTGGQGKREPRSTRSLLISIGAHIVVGIALLQLLTFGHGLSGFLGLNKQSDDLEERLTYVAPAKPKVAETPKAAPKPKVTESPDATQLRAPTTAPVLGTPAAAPPEPAKPASADTGSGAPGEKGVGALDPNLMGVKPGYTDVRVWRGSGGGGAAGAAPGRNGAEKLDSVIRWAITSVADSLDSLARAQGRYGKKPGDWTKTTADGQKWGWDGTGIRLGKVVIPNALLGLLPLNAQKGMSGNYTEINRDKRLALAREDIMRNSERALGEQEFRKLVTELRDRRERERRDRLRAPDASIVTTKPGTPDKQ